MHKAQRGQKLSGVRKVLTPLNFVTPPSFSVTPPSCEPSCHTIIGGSLTGRVVSYDHWRILDQSGLRACNVS